MTDLQHKYQKLAQEYAKIKDQHRVLKEAVIKGKDIEKQYKETVKDRDLKIRKLEQEYDSLHFRSQQLTRKVEGLQIELNSVESRGGKHKVRGDDFQISEPTSQILQDELRGKIEEITKLHQQLNEESDQHLHTVTEIQSKLDNFERENSQNQSVLEGLKREHREIVERLQEDKARLEIRVQNQEKMVQSSTLSAAQCSDELKNVQADLEKKIQWAMGIISNKLPFNDTALNELNSFNVPTHDRKHQKKTKDLIGQSLTIVKELCAGLSNFHTYTEQRCKIFPIDASTGAPISEINQIFCSHLHENASHLRPVEQSFKKFYESVHEDTLTTLETAVELGEVATNFSKYVRYYETILPYQLLSLEEECAISSCPQTLESRNMDVHSSFKKMCSALVALESYVSLLASASSTTSKLPVSNYEGIFTKFSDSATHLYGVMKDVSKCYNFKVSLEHQLPTATQKLKTTDECVVSSLISLVNCSGKFANFLMVNQDFFATPIEFRTRGHSFIGSSEAMGSSPTVTQLRQRAAMYIDRLTRPCPESVPYYTAIKEHKVLISSVESKEGLSSQLLETKEKVNKLTEEKEHWVLEAQLVQMKLDQEKKRSNELQDQLMKGGQPLTTSPPNETPQEPERKDHGMKATSVEHTKLGQFTMVSMNSETADAVQRELRIKEHYKNILKKEMQKCQEAEGKVVSFSSECRAMQKRLGLSERLKTGVLREQKETHQEIATLKDDLQVVKVNYDAQLQVMSDHLCERNERLASQKDEIDALKLKLQQQKQPIKKGRGK